MKVSNRCCRWRRFPQDWNQVPSCLPRKICGWLSWLCGCWLRFPHSDGSHSRGLEFVKNNNSETIANVIKSEFTGTSFDDIVKVVDRYKGADSWQTDTTIREGAYNNLLDLMEYNKVISERPEFDTLVYNE